MACVENWPLAETQNASQALVIVITVPNDCYEFLSLSYDLPPGMSPDDLCNYQSGDLIAVVKFQDADTCNPESEPVTISTPTTMYLNSEGNRVQLIAYYTNSGTAKSIGRSRHTYTNMGS